MAKATKARELGDSFLTLARSATEVLGADVVGALEEKRGRGRPSGSVAAQTKAQVTQEGRMAHSFLHYGYLSMLVKALRIGLGQLIVLGDTLSRPRPLQRSKQGQTSVQEQARLLGLYQFHACPFCVKTRRAMHKLNVPIALHDAKNDPQARAQLLEGGGKVKVPCLRIEESGGTRWMYESSDIIAYLEQRFAHVA